MDDIDFANLVRRMRWLLGLTQEDFAAKIGVRLMTVGRWENGHTNPSRMAIERLESVLREMGDRGRDLLEQYFD